jgi:uncharacterized protein YegL
VTQEIVVARLSLLRRAESHLKEISMSRRLPVFFVVDVSESMAGAPLQSVRDGMDAVLSVLRSDPRALEAVHLALLTFGAKARQLVPLVPLEDFVPPSLPLGTGTPLGAALGILLHALDGQVVPTSSDRKGDWRPLCFLLTDGVPTDEWRAAARALRARVDRGACTVVALACGPDADLSVLREITPNVLVGGADPASLSAFFKFVTMSIRTASIARGESSAETQIPKELSAQEAGARSKSTERPMLFLVGRCQKFRKPYVMKHRWNGRMYEVLEGVAIDDIEIGTTIGAAAQSDLICASPCPHCDNPNWAFCGCERIFCCSGSHGRFTCPWCEKTDDFSPSQFSLRGSGG